MANKNVIAKLAVRNAITSLMKSTALFYKQRGKVTMQSPNLINSAEKERLKTAVFHLQKHHPLSWRLKRCSGVSDSGRELG